MNVLCTFFCIPHLINAQISFYPITTFAHSTLFFGVKIRQDLQNLKSVNFERPLTTEDCLKL